MKTINTSTELANLRTDFVFNLQNILGFQRINLSEITSITLDVNPHNTVMRCYIQDKIVGTRIYDNFYTPSGKYLITDLSIIEF